VCRRGRKNLRTMTKEIFKMGVDDTGHRFVYQIIDEFDKNHRGDNNNPTSVTYGRMYENPGDM